MQPAALKCQENDARHGLARRTKIFRVVLCDHGVERHNSGNMSANDLKDSN